MQSVLHNIFLVYKKRTCEKKVIFDLEENIVYTYVHDIRRKLKYGPVQSLHFNHHRVNLVLEVLQLLDLLLDGINVGTDPAKVVQPFLSTIQEFKESLEESFFEK